MRLIHAVRDLSAETGTRIETVALYTDADRHVFVREADLAYLGPGLGSPLPGLRGAGAGAGGAGPTPPGSAGVRRRGPGVRRVVREVGVTFVGPNAAAMRKLGDKIGAKLLAEEAGVPVAPWSGRPVAHPRSRASSR